MGAEQIFTQTLSPVRLSSQMYTMLNSKFPESWTKSDNLILAANDAPIQLHHLCYNTADSPDPIPVLN